MQLNDAIISRKSIRNFSKIDISFDELEEILNAGIKAPSAKNRQPWYFYIIKDDKTKQEFIRNVKYGIEQLSHRYKKMNVSRYDITSALKSFEIANQAAAIILVSYKKKYNNVFDDGVNWNLKAIDIEVADILSIGAAIENMLLKATDMGYGTLWVCDIFYAYPQITRFVKATDPIVSAIYIGKSNENPINRPRLKIDEISCLLNEEKLYE